MKSPHLAPSRGGRQVRVPAHKGAVPGRREAPGARGPWKFRPRRDPSSASRPYPGSPSWGLALWARAPTGKERMASGGCVIATPITAPPPPTRVVAPAGVSKCPAGLPHPGVGPGCRQKAQFRSPSLGLTRVLAAPRRRLSPASVLDLGPRPPPPCRVSCVQITAESPSNRRWPFLPGGSPGEDPYLRKSSLGLSRGLELRGFWSSSRPDPLAGSGAAVPAIFNILFCFAGTCCPTIIVYSCCCCCCCRQVASVVSDSVRPHGRQPTRLPRSLGVSRQEHRSGLPFSSPTHESEKGK